MKQIEGDIKHQIATNVYDLVYIKIEAAIGQMLKDIRKDGASQAINEEPIEKVCEETAVIPDSAKKALAELEKMNSDNKVEETAELF